LKFIPCVEWGWVWRMEEFELEWVWVWRLVGFKFKWVIMGINWSFFLVEPVFEMRSASPISGLPLNQNLPHWHRFTGFYVFGNFYWGLRIQSAAFNDLEYFIQVNDLISGLQPKYSHVDWHNWWMFEFRRGPRIGSSAFPKTKLLLKNCQKPLMESQYCHF